MYNVLMFVDSGVDDSFALMYALLHPDINVVGVVSGYGNITKEQSVNNTAYLLKLASREDIPIIAGASGPLSGEIAQYYPEIHGEEGLGPIILKNNIGKVKAFDFHKIIEVVQSYSNNLIIVGLGRQTDIALPYIIYGENVFKHVLAFYIMGGAFLVPGNITAEAEANFYSDPWAASQVLEKGRNIFLHPLNVTSKAVIPPKVIDYLSITSRSPFKAVMKPAYDYYLEAYKKNIPGIQAAPLHDVLTISALVNRKLVKYIQRKVTIGQYGKAKGLSMADFRPKPDAVLVEKRDWIGMEVDVPAFISDFVKVFL
ncbi:nucleoside hydrolase [Heyndrickxia sporothermodurans]|nr:nucleoside hydrolase [Heyndrickxia sporothermodurans]